MLDIETSLIAYSGFSLWQDHISHDNILQDWFIICAAWKWYGSKKISSVSVLDEDNKNLHNDKFVVKTLLEATEEADVVVTHNGDKFDLKKLYARCIFHKLKPFTRNIPTIDTLKMAKKYFNFTSNRLDYLGQYLGVGKKIKTSPGLWIEVLKGNKKAIQEMVKYNKGDVLLEEAVLERFAPFIDHPSVLKIFDDRPYCTNILCNSANVQKHQIRYTRTGAPKQRYLCMDCGATSTAKKKEKASFENILKSY